ncbi:MAG TPA: OmpH family outer membrane protein [Alphaproteobacteria bacterium]|nr:OmpH family outer membrane protein [Alphaproteobacteria bacterium]
MKTKLLNMVAAAALTMALATGAAFAEDAPKAAATSQAKTPVVIVVDVNKIMTESAAAKSIQSQVSSMRKSLKDDVEKKEANLRAQDEKLAKDRTTLSAEEFEKKRRGFEEEVMASRKDLDKRVGALDKSVAVAMGKVEKELQTILFDIAKEQKANLVLPKAAILVAETTMDFTDQAMSKINSKLPSVKIESASAPAAKPAEKK